MEEIMKREIEQYKNNHEIEIRSSAAEYLTFIAATGDEEDSIEIRYEDENIWLTQKMMATLYDVSVATINEHLKIFLMIWNCRKKQLLGIS